MKKTEKKNKTLIRRLTRLILSLVLFIFVFANLPIFVLINNQTQNDYSDWMSDNLSSEQKVIDVIMPGAHDALSSNIGVFSKVDELSASSVMKGVPGVLIRGFAVKQSKTQVSNITKLLNNGIRYIDARVTLDEDGEYYTVHNFYSDLFKNDLAKISTFLSEHSGEFLILDLQHIYGVDYESQTDFDAFFQVLENSGILEYAYRNDNGKSLNEITYNDITENKNHAGLIILSKFKNNNEYIWDYESSIRSAWADSDNFDKVSTFLRNEKTLIDEGNALTGNQVANATNQVDSRQAFRVMQAVTTMQMTPSGIFNGIFSISLLAKERHFNDHLMNLDDINELMTSMPIVMLDYADSNYNKFIDHLMEKVIDLNANN